MATSTRRQPVAQGGGLFSTPKPSFSKETQDLLKLMMQESKLTNFQQRKLRENMMNGEALPAQCAPTSSSRGSSGKPVRPSGKRKTASGATQRGLRSKEVIQKMAANDSSPSYRPPLQKYDVTREKQRLQNLMTYGSSEPQPAPQVTQTQDSAEDEDRDRFEEVLEEIEERRQFLSDMEALGQGKEHHSKITTEISQRIRELEVIDKDRTAQLMNLENS